MVKAQLPAKGQWPLKAERFEVDRLQNIYGLDRQHTVTKYLPSGKEVFMYSNLSLGSLYSFDTSDPFNLLLFYRDFQTAVQLDRTLNERGQVFFPEIGLPQVDCIAQSRDNQLWIYDGIQSRLIKIDVQGKVLAESQNLSLLAGGIKDPDQLMAVGQYVFLVTGQEVIHLFNAFGQFLKIYSLEGKRVVQAWPEGLILAQGSKAWLWDPAKPLLPLPCTVPEDGVWKLAENRIIQLSDQGLSFSSW